MQQHQSYKTDFTFSECKLLIRILNINYKEHERITYSQLAKLCETHSSTPNFHKISQYLKHMNILKIIEEIGTAKLISIDQLALKDLIDEQLLINYFFNYFQQHHVCKW